MSAPLPFQLAPAYPDAELFLLSLYDAFLPTLLEVAPTMRAERIDTWLPAQFDPPYLRVQRTGGSPDAYDVTDYPVLTVATYGTTRMAAWNMARVVEQVTLGVKYRSIDVEGVGPVLCDSVVVLSGGEQLPDLDPDDRRVDQTFQLGFRRV